MVLETVVDYNFCFPVGCNPPVFFMFILTFMGDAFLFDVTLGDLRIKREFPCLKAGDDSVFVYTFFWFSIYFLTVSSDICPTDSTK